MHHTERANAHSHADASVIRGAQHHEAAHAEGFFKVTCVGPDGKIKWYDTIKNTVLTEGKNVMLDAGLAGAGYTVTGPFLGLISSVGFTAIAAGDTAAQINGTNGWKEAGSGVNFPLYTVPRKTCAWNAAAAGAKAFPTEQLFQIITTGGTVKGCFIVYGAGASATIANTGGALWSAGLFATGDKIVGVGDTLKVSYSTSL